MSAYVCHVCKQSADFSTWSDDHDTTARSEGWVEVDGHWQCDLCHDQSLSDQLAAAKAEIAVLRARLDELAEDPGETDVSMKPLLDMIVKNPMAAPLIVEGYTLGMQTERAAVCEQLDWLMKNFDKMPESSGRVYALSVALTSIQMAQHQGRAVQELSPPARAETGAMRFGDDWTGVFIRGDNALAFALGLTLLDERAKGTDLLTINERFAVRNVLSLLREAKERPAVPGRQNMRPFGVCHVKTEAT